jgi:GH35 family endo-1,4-beta-xylanase
MKSKSLLSSILCFAALLRSASSEPIALPFTDPNQSLGALADARGLEFGFGWHPQKQADLINTATSAEQINFFAAVGNSYTTMFGFRMNNILPTSAQYYNNQYNYSIVDNVLGSLTLDKGLAPHVHVLLYSVPDWISTLRGSGTAAARTELKAIQNNYIRKVMAHVNDELGGANAIVNWDVANETIAYQPYYEGQPTQYHVPYTIGGTSVAFNSNAWFWAEGGPDYLKDALKSARAADYNDILKITETLGDTSAARARYEDFYQLIKWLKQDRSVPLDAVGLQFHLRLGELESWTFIREYLRKLAALGVDIYITELDVRLPDAADAANNGGNPYPNWLSQLNTQADIYEEVTQIALENPAVRGIYLWGWTDTATWHDDLEMIFRTQQQGFSAKPAYWAIRDALQNYTGAQPRPTHHWRFDHTGDNLDRGWTTQVTNANLQNGAQLANSTARLGGGSVYLDGTNDFVRLNSVAMEDAFDRYTVAFWFRPDRVTGVQVLYDEGGGTNGLCVRLNGTTLEARAKNGGQTATVTKANITAGAWHHAVITFQPGSLRLLHNGGADWDNTVSVNGFNAVGGHSGAASIGYRENGDAFGTSGSGSYFKGRIDDLRIYDGVAISRPSADLIYRLPTADWVFPQ